MTQHKNTEDMAAVPADETISLDSLKAELGKIKPLNRTALDLIRSIDGDEITNIAVLTDKLCMDQVMISRILKISNSPFYGMSGHITSIQEAIAVLGYRSLRSLAIALTLDSCFDSDGSHFKTAQLWPERVFVACFAHHMAPLVQLSRDTAYSIGLLHDIGKLVLYTLHPEKYPIVVETAKRYNIPFHHAEKLCLGFDYATVGKLVCETWRIPETITAAVSTHLEPTMSQVNYGLLLNAATTLYDSTRRIGFTSALFKKTESDPVFRYLGFTQAICEKHMGNITDEVQQTVAMLST